MLSLDSSPPAQEANDEEIVLARYLTPQEGDLFAMRLRFAGAHPRLENVQFTTWFWHLSNATRGVTLRVPANELALVSDELSEANRADKSQAAQVLCLCGEPFIAGWLQCWRCGAEADGSSNADFFTDKTIPSAPRRWQAFDAPAVLCMLITLLAILAPVLLLVLLFGLLLGLPTPEPEETDPQPVLPEEDAAKDSDDSTCDEGDEICGRALRSSLFALGWFPPLWFHSIFLLTTFDSIETPPSLRGWRWYIAAWLVNGGSIATFAVLAAVLVADTWRLGMLSPWIDAAYMALEFVRRVVLGLP
jgi:hypothetical protein